MKFTYLLASVLAFSAAQAVGPQDPPPAADRVVTVMSLNANHGVAVELNAVAGATDFNDLLLRVAAVYQGYFARNFHERAAAMAARIEAERPDLVGVQEAVLVRTQFPPDGPATPATDVALDYLEILLDALAARGLHYEVVVQSIGWDAELPSALGIDVRHTDRELILARSDLKVSDLKLSNAMAGHFLANCQVPSTALGTMTIQRGWASVDAKIRGKSFRFITTHLDGDCTPFTFAFQQAQMAELLAGPAVTDLPVVLVGDLNSPTYGSSASYDLAIGAGFTDAVAAAGLDYRLTCCQANDLLNPASTFDRRIDYVFYRGDFQVLGADVVGDDPADRTPSGLWPSDHAFVVTTLAAPR
jgi:endonuclease/exonuclease/phosphatase family metal-dependent hydrolase